MKQKIEPLHYRQLNGKQLTMQFIEKDGKGFLIGLDIDQNVYILTEVIIEKEATNE